MDLCTALERMQQTVSFRWDCQTRVESLARPGVIDAIARAGCDAVYVGVEALDADTLIYLGKTDRPDRYVDTLFTVVVPQLLASSINCYINLQYGVVGDTSSKRERRQHIPARLTSRRPSETSGLAPVRVRCSRSLRTGRRVVSQCWTGWARRSRTELEGSPRGF
jgi:hypothetical protein